MTIRTRLSLAYTSIVLLAVLFFGMTLLLILESTLYDEIDRSLEESARDIVEITEVRDVRSMTVLSIPADRMDIFQSATRFLLLLDNESSIITRSDNLAGFETLLDPELPEWEPATRTVEHFGRPMRVLTWPLVVVRGEQRERLGFLQVARNLEFLNTLQQLRTVMVITGAVAILVSVLLGMYFTERLLRPLKEIAAVAVRITSTDDLSLRVPERERRDEIGSLAAVINQTLRRLQKMFRTQRRLLADVSHELRTPLTTIRGNIDLIQRHGLEDGRGLDIVQDELGRMTRMVNDLLLLARSDSGNRAARDNPVQLDGVLLNVVRQVSVNRNDVEIAVASLDQITVSGDEDRLRQLILNLVENAVKFSRSGGHVVVSLVATDHRCILTVADDGPGIPKEALPYVFDRFFTLDQSRSKEPGGTGLGLSIAESIAKTHGGTISVESEVGQGTTVNVNLPLRGKIR